MDLSTPDSSRVLSTHGRAPRRSRRPELASGRWRKPCCTDRSRATNLDVSLGSSAIPSMLRRTPGMSGPAGRACMRPLRQSGTIHSPPVERDSAMPRGQFSKIYIGGEWVASSSVDRGRRDLLDLRGGHVPHRASLGYGPGPRAAGACRCLGWSRAVERARLAPRCRTRTLELKGHRRSRGAAGSVQVEVDRPRASAESLDGYKLSRIHRTPRDARRRAREG
jgi:hypothetical protein